MQASFCGGFHRFSRFSFKSSLSLCLLLYRIHFSLPVTIRSKKSSFLLRARREMATFVQFNLFLSVKRCATHVSRLETYPSFVKWRNAVELSIFSLSAISSIVILGFSSTKTHNVIFQVETTISKSAKPLFSYPESRIMVQMNVLNVFLRSLSTRAFPFFLNFSCSRNDLSGRCLTLKWHTYSVRTTWPNKNTAAPPRSKLTPFMKIGHELLYLRKHISESLLQLNSAQRLIKFVWFINFSIRSCEML